jgi:preprotein translocase subunit SecA
MLGGSPDFIADQELHQRGLSPVDTPEDYEAAWPEALAKSKAAVAAEHEKVVEAGGLYVLGTERHESRRIDNQLRGRSGRQGDPGKSRFYLSLEDDLMRMFRSDRVAALMDRMNIPADVPVENKVVSRAIRSAQTQVEQQNFEIRKDVLKYDDVLNRQRQVIYGERRQVLEGADLHVQIRAMLDEVTADYVTAATSDGYPEEWDLDKLWKAFRQLYRPSITVESVLDEVGGEKANLTADILKEAVQEDAQAAYDRREEELTPEVMRDVERRVVLSVLDRRWREHLYEMDYLREGIGLRAMAQRDPLVEYQREGFDMFNEMMEGIKEESVTALFNLQIEVQQNPIVEEVQDNVIPGMLFGQKATPQQGKPPASGTSSSGNAASGTPTPTTPTRPRRRPVPPPPAAPEPAAPVPAAFGGSGAGTKTGGKPGLGAGTRSGAGAGTKPGPGAGTKPGPGAGTRSGAGSQPGAGQPGGSRRGRHAADGRGHATAAGRGQAATRSSVAPPSRTPEDVEDVVEERPSGPVLPPGFEPRRPRQLQYSAPSDSGGVEVKRDSADPYANIGRNDPCPCGSGKKYKRCHGDPASHA